MKVLHLSLTPLVGAPQNICNALNRIPDVSARSAVLNDSPGMYEKMSFSGDLSWQRDREEIVHLAKTSDVLHLHNFIGLDNKAFDPIDFQKLWKQGRPMVRHFHSTPASIARYLKRPETDILECPIPKLVIAQHPARFYANARIVPNLFVRPAEMVPSAEACAVRLGYAPTHFTSARSSRWDTKAYFETLKVIKRVRREARKRGHPLEVDIIEQVSHKECMVRKSQCHIVIDELATGGYHLNTLESLAAGSVVLSYVDEATRAALASVIGGARFPAVNVGLEDAAEVLLDLISRPSVVAGLGAHGRSWMSDHWDEMKMVRHYVDAYSVVQAAPGERFEGIFEIDESARQWRDVQFNDVLWANRTRRWPKPMPDWLRSAKGRLGGALRRVGIRR